MKTRLIVVTIITNTLYEVAIIAGGLWLLPRLGYRLPLWGIITAAVVFAAWAAFCFQIGLRTLKKKPLAGFTDMIGLEGVAAGRLNPEGYVKVAGELWRARAENETIPAGTRVEVTGQKELKLVVRARPKDDPLAKTG